MVHLVLEFYGALGSRTTKVSELAMRAGEQTMAHKPNHQRRNKNSLAQALFWRANRRGTKSTMQKKTLKIKNKSGKQQKETMDAT